MVGEQAHPRFGEPDAPPPPPVPLPPPMDTDRKFEVCVALGEEAGESLDEVAVIDF